MIYEQLKEYLMPSIAETLVCIFKTGSQLFCSNCKDYDYVIITKEEVNFPCFYIKELNLDCFVMSVDTLNRRLQDNQWRYKLSVCMAKADSSNIIYGELPQLDIDILSKEYFLRILAIENEYAQKTYFTRYPLKTMVWGLALYYVILNNKLEFTDEQKVLLQKCHDLELSVDFRNELKINFENLLAKEA